MALQSIDPKEFVTVEGTPKVGVVKQETTRGHGAYFIEGDCYEEQIVPSARYFCGRK